MFLDTLCWRELESNQSLELFDEIFLSKYTFRHPFKPYFRHLSPRSFSPGDETLVNARQVVSASPDLTSRNFFFRVLKKELVTRRKM